MKLFWSYLLLAGASFVTIQADLLTAASLLPKCGVSKPSFEFFGTSANSQAGLYHFRDRTISMRSNQSDLHLHEQRVGEHHRKMCEEQVYG